MNQPMLTKLKAALGFVTEAAPVAADVTEATASLQVQFDAFRLESESQINEMTAAVQTAVTAVAEADSKVAELQAALDVLKNEKAALEASNEAAKLSDRKAQVLAAVGTEKTDAVMTAVAGLDATQFSAVLAAMTTTITTEAKSRMFTEQGADAIVDASKIPAPESDEMKILRAQYQIK